MLFNLLTTFKYFMIDSHDRFHNLTRDNMWLNVTVYSQSKVYMAVRQLEFALLQLAQQIDGLLTAMQCVFKGDCLFL